jgi:hypothetical protein
MRQQRPDRCQKLKVEIGTFGVVAGEELRTDSRWGVLFVSWGCCGGVGGGAGGGGQIESMQNILAVPLIVHTHLNNPPYGLGLLDP